MRVLILEDESGAAQNLIDILEQSKTDFEVLAVIETVQNAVEWLKNNTPDLAFFDIQLADGESFEVFKQTTIEFPIIFTTAYDAYAIEAFKVNSIGYLLKPVSLQELENTLEKLSTLRQSTTKELVESLTQQLGAKREYRRSFLIYKGDQLIPIPVEDIAYFFVSESGTKLTTMDDRTFNLDNALNDIQDEVDPNNFYRLNRQYLASRKAITSVSQYFHRKLKANLSPPPSEDVIISKPRAPNLIKWLQ